MHQSFAKAVSSSPDRVALVDDERQLTYRELARIVEAVAAKLLELGIRPGDRMMIVSENCVALAVLLFAASTIDAWSIVANPRLSARELDLISEHSGTRRVFIGSGVSEHAAAHARRLGASLAELPSLEGVSVTDLRAQVEPESVSASRSEQVAVLVYTSGTTGTPKGVMLTHENVLFSAKAIAQAREFCSGDLVYLVLPVSHIAGMAVLLMTMMTGGTARLAHRYDPSELADAISVEGISVVYGVPATYQRLLEYADSTGRPLVRNRLRALAVVGAPMDPSLKARVRERIGLNLLNGYGITECSPGISGSRMNVSDDDLSVGPLLPGIEAKIVSKDRTMLPEGEVGELHVRGRYVMKGYYRAPELTAQVVDPEGWFNTGDLAFFRGGDLFIAGRTKEMIIRSGFNVYPAEVEAVLNSHDAVLQSAVVGRPVDGNEEVVAFVQLVQGATATAADILAHAGSQLTAYKRPAKVIVLPEFPVSSTGKILKRKLADSLL
ncbi:MULTISPECIES: class I adenylate-forming enzyme family protein [unclassified Bradyrhizobium]|uniref:class I adenylate-forming enzyme family protein n=1 Tax=unclassified Bradyrhizobium TaxID=2631580 RepID=UPI002FE18E38